MSILKAKNKAGSKGKMIGVVLDEPSQSYLSLYTAARGITKSQIVREQITEWVKTNSLKKRNTRNDLIKQIIKISKKEFAVIQAKNSDYSISDFVSILTIELVKKEFSFDDMEEIISKIRNQLWNENNL